MDSHLDPKEKQKITIKRKLCKICLQPPENRIELPVCKHLFCKFCLQFWFNNLVKNLKFGILTCPICDVLLDEIYLCMVLEPRIYRKLTNNTKQPTFQCNHCESTVIQKQTSHSRCSVCTSEWCSNCFNEPHNRFGVCG